MGKPRIYIDGEHGTTGLEIRERLATRSEIELVSLAPRHGERPCDQTRRRQRG